MLLATYMLTIRATSVSRNGWPGLPAGLQSPAATGPGPLANQLSDPQGLYLDQQGNIYIADDANERIQEWPPLNSINTGLTPTVAGTYTAAVTDVNGCTL